MRLHDLSLGGAYVNTTAIFKPGDPVTLVAMLGGTETPLHGRVVYSHVGMGFGLSFHVNEMAEDTRRRIQELVEAG